MAMPTLLGLQLHCQLQPSCCATQAPPPKLKLSLALPLPRIFFCSFFLTASSFFFLQPRLEQVPSNKGSMHRSGQSVGVRNKETPRDPADRMPAARPSPCPALVKQDRRDATNHFRSAQPPVPHKLSWQATRTRHEANSMRGPESTWHWQGMRDVTAQAEAPPCWKASKARAQKHGFEAGFGTASPSPPPQMHPYETHFARIPVSSIALVFGAQCLYTPCKHPTVDHHPPALSFLFRFQLILQFLQMCLMPPPFLLFTCSNSSLLLHVHTRPT